MTDAPQLPIAAPLGSFEPNVVVAGIEGATVAWVGYAAITGTSLQVPFSGDWHWSYAVYAVLAAVGLVLLGLAVEGVAGLLEYAAARHLFGKDRGTLRRWYIAATDPPSDWRDGQRWIWKSPQASHEFARRRLRILVCRNTAVCFLVLTALLSIAIARNKPPLWGWVILGVLAAGLLAVALFGWLWVSAHEGWNKAVRDASILGPP
jgi:MFS family permease